MLIRRGLKRIEQSISHSKQAISVMYCRSAAGTYLSPMIVYKSRNLYAEWTRNGPNGAVYGNSVSGWFDSALFEQWFFNIFLPAAKELHGKKILIGDNLPSHSNINVVRRCEEANVVFVSLIPGATHLLPKQNILTQPT